MTLYTVTIFLSAFLLFQVQPLIAKMILPWFGGSAAVWSASMLFFQLLLLAGYAYAHLSIRFLKPRVQMLVHVALLLGSCALLPILPSPQWRPTQVDDPTARFRCCSPLPSDYRTFCCLPLVLYCRRGSCVELARASPTGYLPCRTSVPFSRR